MLLAIFFLMTGSLISLTAQQTIPINANGTFGPYGPGEYEFVLPPGCSANVTYQAWGGGGAGGNLRFNSVGGGGSGAYLNCNIAIPISCGTYTASVGAGGIPDTDRNGKPTTVGFGTVSTAGGGLGTEFAKPGAAGTATGCGDVNGNPAIAKPNNLVGGVGGSAPSGGAGGAGGVEDMAGVDGAVPGGGGGGHGRDNGDPLTLNSGKGGDGQLIIIISDYTCVKADAGADQAICEGESATIGGVATDGVAPYMYAWDNGAAAVASPMVSPMSTTTYSLTVTDGNNCTATDAVTVTVNAATTPLFTQLGPYCVGDTPAMLPTISTNGIAGTWNAPIITTAIGNTTYTFSPTSTASPDCAQTTTMSVTVMNCTAMTTASINDPSIYDPCFCGNPLNITGANQEVLLFADFVLISGAAAGDTWILSSVNDGDVLDADGNAIVIGTALNDLGGGDFRLDLFHNPDVGFNATFTGIRADGTPYASPLSVGGSCSPCPLIPTMSQWGLLIFGLLILNLSVGLISEKRKIEITTK